MKYSFGISNFLEEITSLSHSLVFLYFFASKNGEALYSKQKHPSTFAGGLKELLRMPMRSQGYCGDGRGLSGLHWVVLMEEGLISG